jgi:hypothetical protein
MSSSLSFAEFYGFFICVCRLKHRKLQDEVCLISSKITNWGYLFATLCTVVGRQRINANGFECHSPERKHSVRINPAINHNYIFLFIFFWKPLTLFAPILLHHVRVVWSSSLPMLSLPTLSTACLSFPPAGGQGPPSLPSPKLTLFPSGSRQQPASVPGTVFGLRKTCGCPPLLNRTTAPYFYKL